VVPVGPEGLGEAIEHRLVPPAEDHARLAPRSDLVGDRRADDGRPSDALAHIGRNRPGKHVGEDPQVAVLLGAQALCDRDHELAWSQ
jgi:hypothetical protein